MNDLSLLTSRLPAPIRSQESKLAHMREIVAKNHSQDQGKREDIAYRAQLRGQELRSLKHPFSTDVEFETSQKGNYINKVIVLKDLEANKTIYRSPTLGAINTGEKAREDNIQRILDILV